MKKRRRRHNSFVIDLSDTPRQPPISKRRGRIKEEASKYTGVSFDKPRNKWTAQIKIEGKKHCIGYYDNEEHAVVDCARAVFKYRGQGALDRVREQDSFTSKI
jgi:hypothetical protein